MLSDRAPAKINLTLRVLGRREDGYHLLDSLVGFSDCGDDLALEPGVPLALTIDGPMSEGLVSDDNLILRAAELFFVAFPAAILGRFHLTKNLPVASGIGGGSSDAASALRLLARANGMDAADPRILTVARALGADVPVCMEMKPRRMQGIGHELGPALDFAERPALLVNPGIGVETRAVFVKLGLVPGTHYVPVETPFSALSPEPEGELSKLFGENHLERPALEIAPEIAHVLEALKAQSGCRLARMSGSGATCFALFESRAAALRAAGNQRMTAENWWVQPCHIQIPR
jgi:4-diphosphocytidyl-2-C-methyl-D-erythritol kinase